MQVIGVSGSPRNNSSVDKLVKLILENLNNYNAEIISLKDLLINPCKGCLGCLKTNKCVQKDDWASVEETIRQAELMVLGVPAYYGAAFGINALTHNFLERWFAFRHQGLKLNLRKVMLAIVSGEGHGEITAKYLKTFFEMYHGVEVVDNIIASGTTPCYVCGFGEHCAVSAFLHRHGEGAKITKDMIVPIEKQTSVIENIKKIKLADG